MRPADSIKPKLAFFIDVVGSCNLSCPSCPVGNMPSVNNGKAVMTLDLLEAILSKATEECDISDVHLYNWTEPFLHPRIDEMVQIVKKRGLRCYLSTNLNIYKQGRFEKILAAKPDFIRVSTSGFHRETYELTHRGGDVDIFRNNLDLFLNLRNEMFPDVPIQLCFHRYLTNVSEEAEIRRYCQEHFIAFDMMNALLTPVEKVLAYCGEKTFETITDQDQGLIDRLALPLSGALRAASKSEPSSCRLLEDQVVLDSQGDVMLCCAVYDKEKYGIGRYLEQSLDAIQNIRRQKNICSECIRHGVNKYLTYQFDGIDKLVEDNIKENN